MPTSHGASSLASRLSGVGSYYPLTTNGKSLVIKGVLIQGERYDIVIKKRDLQGNYIWTEDSYLNDTIARVVLSVQEIYENLPKEQILTAEFHCDGNKCEKKILDSESVVLAEGLSHSGTLPNNPMIAGSMKIHDMLFNQMVAGFDRNGLPTTSPQYEDLDAPGGIEIDLDKYHADDDDFDIDDFIEESFSKVLFRNKVSFLELCEYMKRKDNSVDTGISPLYDSLLRICADKTEERDMEMLVWLAQVYVEALKESQKSEDAVASQMAEELALTEGQANNFKTVLLHFLEQPPAKSMCVVS